MTLNVSEPRLRVQWLSLPLMIGLIAIWSVVVVAGFCALWSYAAAPGDNASPPKNWPPLSAIVRDGRPTLLLFAHPHCPCTRATLAELERLLAVSHDQFDAHILFIAPYGTDSSWRDSELCRVARRIPSVTVQEDAARGEAKLFRARTSGTCLLYDSAGRLQFQGGLTAARGHEGDNEGTSSIRSLLNGEPAASQTRVFGCPLHESTIVGPVGRSNAEELGD